MFFTVHAKEPAYIDYPEFISQYNINYWESFQGLPRDLELARPLPIVCGIIQRRKILDILGSQFMKERFRFTIFRIKLLTNTVPSMLTIVQYCKGNPSRLQRDFLA